MAELDDKLINYGGLRHFKERIDEEKGCVYDETNGNLTQICQDETANTNSGQKNNVVLGENNTLTGAETEASSIVGGYGNRISGSACVVGGYQCSADGTGSNAFGFQSDATGFATAIGVRTLANGQGCFAVGNGSASKKVQAIGNSSIAMGKMCIANGDTAFAAGDNVTATGSSSHATGNGTTAQGFASSVNGRGTIAQNSVEFAEGNYNVSHKASNNYGDAGNTQHSIGIGSSENAKSNALEVMQNGNMYVLGVGGYQGTDTNVQDASVKTLQEVVNGKADAYEVATNSDVDSLFA